MAGREREMERIDCPHLRGSDRPGERIVVKEPVLSA
jgi:hypothetical protein